MSTFRTVEKVIYQSQTSHQQHFRKKIVKAEKERMEGAASLGQKRQKYDRAVLQSRRRQTHELIYLSQICHINCVINEWITLSYSPTLWNVVEMLTRREGRRVLQLTANAREI